MNRPTPAPRTIASAGFTLFELLVTVTVIMILAAIVSPAWLSFLARQRVSRAQIGVLALLRQAQANAQREKRPWQVCFGEFPDSDGVRRVKTLVQPISPSNPAGCATTDPRWENLLGENARHLAILDNSSSINNFESTDPSPNLTTLAIRNGWRSARFDHKGQPSGLNSSTGNAVGKLTLAPKDRPNSSPLRRCVIVSTLLGALRSTDGNNC